MRTADGARATGVEGVADRVKAGELKALRTAVRDGVEATAARSSKTECKHNALFNGCTAAGTTTCAGSTT
ncbi:hypothetical protein [Streptomyces sp. NPDC005336]|uniref:hypothetical protein n=1 Tax=unclassified Streptomyces TaxID=2593676 RepID=UPI00339E3A17